MFYVWFLVAVFLGILELATTNLVSIWFVISSLVAMIISKFTTNVLVEVTVFVALGIILMPLSKKIYKKIKKSDTKTNIDRIIGMMGVVTEDITMGNIGEVKVDGKRWSAYADTDILKDEKVKILSINSVKLKVERWEDE